MGGTKPLPTLASKHALYIYYKLNYLTHAVVQHLTKYLPLNKLLKSKLGLAVNSMELKFIIVRIEIEKQKLVGRSSWVNCSIHDIWWRLHLVASIPFKQFQTHLLHVNGLTFFVFVFQSRKLKPRSKTMTIDLHWGRRF